MKKLKLSFSERKRAGEIQFSNSIKRKGSKIYTDSNRAKLRDIYVLLENKIFLSRKTELLKEFNFFITPDNGALKILIPKNFSMCDNYTEVIATIKLFASSIFDYAGMKINLDFSDCQNVDVAALFFMQVVRLEMIEKLEKFQKNLSYINIVPEFDVENPKSKNVRRLLISSGYPLDIQNPVKDKVDFDTDFPPLNSSVSCSSLNKSALLLQ